MKYLKSGRRPQRSDVKESSLVRKLSWGRLVLAALLLAGVLHACSGAEFQSSAGQQTTTGNTNTGDGDTPGDSDAGGNASGSTSCLGPEDCDDDDPCTFEVCKATGLCELNPTCGPSERCCDGRCGECCADVDCDDGIGCTVDRCFLGACVAMADDGACANATVEMYCSLMGDCRAREPCPGDTAGECDDADNCTLDTCNGGLCSHGGCAEGTVCCPEFGCGECCTDSQCDDGDPCTVNTCNAGTCEQAPLCGDDDQCCPDLAGSSATCGQCCTRDDCDDEVGCTLDACVQGQCANTPKPNVCPMGQVCTPMGCAEPQQCDNSDDCTSPDPCQTGACDMEMGICHFTGCQNDDLCCVDGCKECCGNPDCDDDNACTNDVCENGSCMHSNMNCERCDPELGCIECAEESHCNDGSDCTTDSCDLETHTCVNTGGACGVDRCCPGGSCNECCSDSDCINDGVAAAEQEQAIILPGFEPCASCDSGKCSALTYCDVAVEWCCAGQCIPNGTDCL